MRLADSKQGQGALPPGPPPKAEPLESISKAFKEGGVQLPRKGPCGDAPLLKSLMGSKGCALSWGSRGAKPPWPYLLCAMSA
jgi:hypothetical protein